MTPINRHRHRQQKGRIFQSSGAWFVQYRVTERQADGTFKRVQRAKMLARVDSAHRRPSSVRDLADQFLATLEPQHANPKSTILLRDFVDQVYFRNVKEIKRPSTIMADEYRWSYQLEPRCGHFPLFQFSTPDGQQLMHEIANDPDSKLSKASLRQCKSLMSAIFKHARTQGYLDGPNPMVDVIVPQSRANGTKPKSDDDVFYTLDEIRTMLKILPEPAATIVAVASFAGLRRGEINGLKWEDYHDGALYITRSFYEGHETQPKTVQSAQPVPVIPPLAQRLDEYRASLGNPVEGWMFPTGNGTPISLNNVRNRIIQPAFKKVGLQWKGYHAFRRGLSTTLYSMGVPDKIIQRIMRHEDLKTTMRSYVKPVADDVKQAMHNLAQKWQDAEKKQLAEIAVPASSVQ